MLNKEKIEQKYAKKFAKVNKKIDLCKEKEDLVIDISIDSEISDTSSKELKKLAILQKKYKDDPTEKNKHKFNALHDKYLYTIEEFIEGTVLRKVLLSDKNLNLANSIKLLDTLSK